MILHRNERASSCYCHWPTEILAFMRMLFLFIILFIPVISKADVRYAAGVGVLANENNNNADVEGSVREKATFGWYAGSRILYSLKDNWAVRTGIGFQEKSALYSFEKNNDEGDVRLSVISLSVPLLFEWKLHNYFSPFGGYTADFGLNDDCDEDGNTNDCSLYGDMKSVVHYAVLGGSFHLNPKWDLDVSYQRALSDTFTDVKIHTLALQIFYNF